MRDRVFAAFLIAAFSRALSAADGSFEKTIPIPRDDDAELEWAHQGCSILSLTVRNLPDEQEVEEARREDPGDKSWVWWEFNVANSSSRKCRISLAVEVLDRKGKVVKSSDRKGSVSPGELDDDIRVSTLMKTLDVADAPRARVRAKIELE